MTHLAASLGVVALLRESQPAFTTVRVAGAAYLIYLGVQTLLAAVRGREPGLSRNFSSSVHPSRL